MTNRNASWKIQSGTKPLTAALVGELSETLSREPLLSQAVQARAVSIDLGEITRVTSAGVREWVDLLKELANQGVEVALTNVSVVVVGQLNMISNFAFGATVVSIHAPYFCESCGEQETRIFVVNDETLSKIEAPHKCTKCGGALEFDDLPERFLAFRQIANS